MAGRSYVEKRDFPRMSIRAEISYRIEGDGASYTGTSNNLSHSGIQFITERALTPGKSIEFRLVSFDGKVDPLEAKARVLRVEPAENMYIVAGTITEYK
jgi:c-di-GMP-binding flagellar brake protein YcgR